MPNFDSSLLNTFVFCLQFKKKRKFAFFVISSSKPLVNLFASLRYCEVSK